MAQSAKSNSSREMALARRRAMSAGGKKALPQSQERTVSSTPAASSPEPAQRAPAPRARTSRGVVSSSSTARDAAFARRKAMSTRGKQAVSSVDRTRSAANVAKSAAVSPAPTKDKEGCGCGCKDGDTVAVQAPRRERPASGALRTSRARNGRKTAIVQSPAKAASLARRQAHSTRGKAGIAASGMTEAQTAR
ncbi:MAG: hypothetical protein WBM63_17130, partial [Sedimenticolaceae bacterium]